MRVDLFNKEKVGVAASRLKNDFQFEILKKLGADLMRCPSRLDCFLKVEKAFLRLNMSGYLMC
jgi:hypothetical protein